MTLLRRLCVCVCVRQSNRLTAISNLAPLTQLEELYLSHNGIETIGGLETLTVLNTLDLSANRLTAVSGLATLTALGDLWVRAMPSFVCVCVCVFVTAAHRILVSRVCVCSWVRTASARSKR